MENNFKSVADFRNKATENDYLELKNYLESFTYPSSEFEATEKYNFSYSSAMKLLKEKGLIENKELSKSKNKLLKKDFIINGYEKLDTMSRTITIDKNTFSLLDKFAELVPAYSKQNVFNKIILEGLENYIDLEKLNTNIDKIEQEEIDNV